MRKEAILVLVFVLTSLLFVSICLIEGGREYQDSWILEDVFWPWVLFTFIFFYIVVILKNNRLITLLTSIYIVITNSIPAFKYKFFYGISDSHYHFRMANEILNTGHVLKGTAYTGTPNLHIYLSSFSQILGVSLNESFKYALPLAFGLFPLWIYIITTRFKITKELQKWVIISSSLLMYKSYEVWGTTFGLIFYFMIFLILIIYIIYKNNKNLNFNLCIIMFVLLVALVSSHGVTALMTLITLSVLTLFFAVCIKTRYYIKFPLKSPFVISEYKILRKLSLYSFILFVGWWMYEANFIFSTFVKNIFNMLTSQEFRKIPIPSRLFELTHLAQIKIFLVYHANDFVIYIMLMISIYILVRERKFCKFHLYFLIQIFSMLVFIIIEILIKFGDLEYSRLVAYSIIFSPFFISITLSKIDKKISKLNMNVSNTLKIILLTCIMIFSSISFFIYQPLVPKGRELIKNEINISESNFSDFNFSDFENDYVVYVNGITTIYQIKTVEFAKKSWGTDFLTTYKIISTDLLTKHQLASWGNIAPEKVISWINPRRFNYKIRLLLFHYPGRSGSISESIEYRTFKKINELKMSGNLIYNNGESFAMLERS